MRKLDVQIAESTSTTIKDLIKEKPKTIPKSDAGIYMIPCRDCNQCYIGETARTIKKRIYEHKRALQIDDQLNALVGHRNKYDHNFNLKKTQMIKYIHQSSKRKCIEAILISKLNTIEQRPGFFQLTDRLNNIILKQEKIKY